VQQILFTQVSEDEQVPQLPPHPSSPHSFPTQLGVQVQTPPTQVSGEVQPPQFTVLETPQLFSAVTGSHSFPNLVQNAVFDS